MNYIIHEVTGGWVGIRGGDFYFRPHFQVEEFACKDGSDYIKVSSKTLDCIEEYRCILGVPVYLSSAYRALYYNSAKVGSTDSSQHVRGTAVDVTISGAMLDKFSVDELIALAWSVGFVGIGYYNYYDGYGNHVHFLHLDTRDGERVYWEEVR